MIIIIIIPPTSKRTALNYSWKGTNRSRRRLPAVAQVKLRTAEKGSDIIIILYNSTAIDCIKCMLKWVVTISGRSPITSVYSSGGRLNNRILLSSLQHSKQVPSGDLSASCIGHTYA